MGRIIFVSGARSSARFARAIQELLLRIRRRFCKFWREIWVDSAKKDAGDFTEAVALLPEVFGPGKNGTSGVNSCGGKQNFKDELCAWKRVAKDGKHYRILEHTTGYFYHHTFFESAPALTLSAPEHL